MPNIKISDLEPIAPGFDPDAVFLEAQQTVAGEPASRKISVTEVTAGAGPLAATYVTVTANAILPNERILTAGADIDIADGGAGGNITISLTAGASYFKLTATGRVVGSDAGTSQTGDNVILGGALAGDLNIADGVIALGQNALAIAAALDFVGSIAIGRNAGALLGDTRDPWVIIGDGAAANITAQSFHDANTIIGTRALGALGGTTNVQQTVIIGHDACSDMTGAAGLGVVNNAVIIGSDAGIGNVGASITSAVLIGSRVCSDLRVGGVQGSVVIGNNTGEQLGGASLNVLIGSNNTANAVNVDDCIVIGCNTFATGAAQTATQILIGNSSFPGILAGETNILIGHSVGITGTQLDFDHCVIIGHLAGSKLIDDQDIFAIEQPQSNTSNLARPYLFGNFLNGNLALLNIAAMTGGVETGSRIVPAWADAAPVAGQGVFSMYGLGTDLGATTDDDFVHFYVATADSALTLRYPLGDNISLLHDGTDSIIANSAGDMQLVGTGAVVLAPNSVEGLRLTEDNSGVLQVPSASVAITANAGGGQVGAVPLIHSYNVVTVVASFNDSVRLPDVFAINSIVYVKNDGANRVAIFPASGDDLGEGVDALISLPTGSSYAFIATVANSTWTQLVDSGIATALLGLNNNGPQIADIAPTDVIPTILPNKVDIDTGLGWTGSDIWGLIAGGVQAFQLRELGGGVVQAPSASLAVTAFAGGGQVSATPLIDSYNVITVVATAGDSVRLPSAFSANPSALVYIKNDDATEAADVFPASGDDLGAGVDTAVSLLAGQSLTFIATVANSTWTPLIVDTAGGAGISGEFDNLLLSQTPGVHAASPTLRFGDGNTGFYENSDNQLAVSIGGVPELFFDSLGIRTVVSSGPTFANIAASSTVPTLIPNQQEQDTGIGWTSADRIAIISGGSLVAEFLNTAGVEQVIIPLQNNASTPSLAFGDGNTGFFESADNILTTSIGGTSILEQVSNGIRLAAANGPMLLNETPSATNAVIIPNKGDGSTGIGQAASNQLTLVANNVLALNAHGVNSGALIDTSRQTGITAFAGGGQGSAVHLVNSVCIIATVATTGDSVRLANQFRPGATISIKNNGANAADVFPSSGDNLGLGIDTAYSLPAGKWVTFMGVTSNSVWELWSPDQILFEQGGSAANPTIAFGDGNTGFYESVDNDLELVAGGADRATLTPSGLESALASSWEMRNEVPTATNPVFIPAQTDTDTGLGWAAADQLSLVAGGLELLRLVETGVATTDQVRIGPAGVIGAVGTPSLAFGDGDTGLFESADDVLNFVTLGATAMTVNAAGLVSVGTAGLSTTGDITMNGQNILSAFRIDASTDLELRVNVSENAIIARQNGGVEIYHDNVQYANTQSVAAAVNGVGFAVINSGGFIVPVRVNSFGVTEDTTTYTIDNIDGNQLLRINNTTNKTWTVDNVAGSNWDIGDVIRITRDTATGTFTLSPGAGVTIRWRDGGSSGTGSHSWTLRQYGLIRGEMFSSNVWYFWNVAD